MSQSAPRPVPDRPLALELCSLAAIKPYSRNPRSHPARQIDAIMASIKQFGFANPILIDESGIIIAGHGRYLAARKLELPEVPVIRLAGLTEAQQRALRIADNKLVLGAHWDDHLLRVELQAITLELDPAATGFSIGEIDIILSDGDRPAEDPIPASPAEPIAKPGDIYILGEHRIGCGDCRDLAFLRRVVGDTTVDAAFLDPPYNQPIDGHVGGKGRIKHREFAMASGEMSSPAFVAFLKETLGACAEVSRQGAVHFVCMDHQHAGELIGASEDVYARRLNIVVWRKSNAGMGSPYRSQHELIFVLKVGDAPHLDAIELGRHGRNRTNVWDYAGANTFHASRRHDLALHPTVKPIALVADAIKDVTGRGDRVLDAFLGSGTTLLAAERTRPAAIHTYRSATDPHSAATRIALTAVVEPALRCRPRARGRCVRARAPTGCAYRARPRSNRSDGAQRGERALLA